MSPIRLRTSEKKDKYAAVSSITIESSCGDGDTMMPLLTVFANLMGLIGGAGVLLSMDYPLVTYVQEVRGAGVVGEQPVLKPGDSDSYTSGCPLKTSSGFMVGAYQMQLASGELINVEIPPFSLDSPHEKHAIN